MPDSGKRSSKRDLDLQLAVVQELAWETRVRGTDIGVAVGGGVVTLTGTVDSWAEKHAAQQAAHRVHGVLDVANDIAIKPSWSVETTDAELAAAARHALDWHVHIPKNLVIDVWDGVVKLSGVVETLAQREEAEAAIRVLRGLRSIENTIQVEPPPVTEQQLRTSLEDALSRHVGREVQRIAVEVIGDHVKLSGQVDSNLEHTAALGAVIGTRGVRSVEDLIRIAP